MKLWQIHCAQKQQIRWKPKTRLTNSQGWVNNGKQHHWFQTGQAQRDQSAITRRGGLQKILPALFIHSLNKHVPSPTLETRSAKMTFTAMSLPDQRN